MEKFTRYINSPIGWLEIQSTETTLTAICFVDKEANNSTIQPKILDEVEAQLKEYFAGKRKAFNLQLTPEGTEFQQKIWQLVQQVEFGVTASYLDIAKQSGSDKNTRAVGLANGKNPIPIIIPCHRIIGSSGKLTGYAGGLERKRWLLTHELSNAPTSGKLF
ncbi:methylated-DNA--[protein]-cysteine S-methyltransferase [Draconibacterium sp. IB214405]|uniref:methylated-DNA--[protein]-cysteine S-methyltransferase n=1 Tax=Draconibacterium sp. IB214405 TaxID=3097352 RepID=UPI002A0C939C|nr:methylated-DNA--[protein]-cysteine S-methyltransferase [Draconibacterium sp. IB214405]MDX8340616.1 methylated-DNA--[protein]-cysteine S-methyltransferase [Draconibacterium sp. IB214405]